LLRKPEGDGMTQATDPHPALSYRCPFCGAAAGQPCRTRNSGRAHDWPHSRRLALADRDWCVTPTRQALCCQCGHVRSFKQAKNTRGWFGSSPDWHRALGDLKCDSCGDTTTHALLLVDGVREDADAARQRVALGGENLGGWDAERARREYRRGNLPRNPYLHHRYWVNEARAAWAAGKREVVGLCGEPMEMHYDPDGPECDRRDPDELLEPAEVRSDQEYEDPETGRWWLDMDCVDCLRIANAIRLDRARQQLMRELMELATRAQELTAGQVMSLREQLKSVRSTPPPTR
jgi:hypothetical protein